MRQRSRGVTLIELMVAMAIGTLLIIGAVLVYSRSSATYAVNDTIARLQEKARYAFSIIEPDVQLAGYYGFSSSPDTIHYIAGGATSSSISAARLQAASPAISGLPQNCGTNFAVNVLATVEGTDNTPPVLTGCPIGGGGMRSNTDSLTIRRASVATAAATAGQLQLLVSRLGNTSEYLFADGIIPASFSTSSSQLIQVRDMVVHTYYVSIGSQSSSMSASSTNPVPALRVRGLAGLAFSEDATLGLGEVVTGVEDLQLQFGIDTGDYNNNGQIDAGLDEDNDGIPDSPKGIATKYVGPASLAPGIQVVSVRIWIMMRAEKTEPGFKDTRTYTYAGKTYIPNDGYRRLLVARTIQLRNARRV